MRKSQIIIICVTMVCLGILFSYILYGFFMTLQEGLLFHCLVMGAGFGGINAMVVLFFVRKYSNIKLINERLGRELTTDKLTGLRSRRALDNDIKTLDMDMKYSMIFLDIDNFRYFNKTFGHQAGDKVLKKCGATIIGSIRSSDYAYRYGGEEMIVLLKGCGKKEALEIGGNIISNIRSLDNSPYSCITVSAGVAAMPEDAQTFEQLIKASDFAMLKAKKQGKNQVV